MQPTEIQVQQCLRALETGVSEVPGWGRADRTTHEALPDGLVELLRDAPALRLQAIADARMRLAGGVYPSDGDLADRLVGRLVCDRIR